MPKSSPKPDDYLHVCAARHAELTSKLSGTVQNSEAVEKAVAGVRSRGALTYDTVRTIIESTHFSAGRQFWTWPSQAEIEAGLAGETFDLWHLPKNETAILKRLRSVFRTFEAVSVILRFVIPKEYGILSSPVEHVLGIQPAAASIDRYLNYVRDLREIRDKRGFANAAQVDQALYTLQLGVLGGRLDDVEPLKKAHARDKLLRSIKVKNLAEDLKAIIDRAAPGHMHGEWQRSRHLRNRAVHGRALNEREVAELIECTRRILSLSEEAGARSVGA